jgi:hypothetical protein
MVIYRVLQHEPFAQEDIDRLVAAFEETLRVLDIERPTDVRITGLIAKKVIETAQTGVRDPSEISKCVLLELLSQSRWRDP